MSEKHDFRRIKDDADTFFHLDISELSGVQFHQAFVQRARELAVKYGFPVEVHGEKTYVEEGRVFMRVMYVRKRKKLVGLTFHESGEVDAEFAA